MRPEQPLAWDEVVTDLGIDYRWVVSLVPMKDDLVDHIRTVAEIGVQIITRSGGTGVFIIDRETILMTWSGKNVTINSESTNVVTAAFDDTFDVTCASLTWSSENTE